MTTSRLAHGARGAAALLAIATTTLVLPGAARAHDDLPPAIEVVGARARGPQPWLVTAGLRTALFRSAGYDPFSTNDAFPQFSVNATWAYRTGGALETAVGVSFDAGGASAQARGSDASLSLDRLAALVEERYAFGAVAYAFARLSPGWLTGKATLSDPSIPAPLESAFSTFSLDASAGGAACLSPRSAHVRIWLVADGGYGWAPTQHLALAPALPASDRDKAGTTSLSDFAPRGVFFRGAVALGF
jgi:hypothetical protein